MPGNFKKKDLRIIKTYKSLLNAFHKLLNVSSFSKITVNDLCEEAQLSRTAFYVHFQDKYKLLEYWLDELKNDFEQQDYSNDQIQNEINSLIHANKKRIKNLMENVDYLTLHILQEYIISILNFSVDSSNDKFTVLSNFCAGGVINSIFWQIKNNFPLDLQLVNEHIQAIIKTLDEWK